MRREDFAAHAPGRLVQARTPVADRSGGLDWVSYCAFVPDPLPPQIDTTSVVVRELLDAYHALGELSGLGRTLANPHLLIRPFLRKEAVLSSRIEGTQASVRDVYAFEAAQASAETSTIANNSDVREVVNYVRALEYALAQREHRQVRLPLIREVHRILMEGVRGDAMRPGEFRTEQVWLGGAGISLGQARFVPPPPIEVVPCLEQLERYIANTNASVPPLVRLAYLHYQFEAIHPFMDGNGRTGRLLLPLFLIDYGLLSQPLLYLSAFFERNRSQYYDLLLAVSQQGAWVEWVRFFLRGIAEQADDGRRRAKRIQDLQLTWRGLLSARGASGRLMGLMEALFESPILTIARVQSLLTVSHTAATNNVERLVELGIVQEIPARYRRLFIAGAVLEAIDDPV